MFTIEEIKTAHSKVKSGAEFPSYIKEIKTLGVTFYEVFVCDGRTDYHGENDYKTSAPPKYNTIEIASDYNAAGFKADLKAHQQGKTDYMTFIADCAKNGVAKWAVCLDKFTCTYFNVAGDEILEEQIPL